MRARATPWCQWDASDLMLRLRVQPKAGRDEFVGPYGDRFKVRITAPPVNGKANAYLIRFLSKAFGVPRNQVTLEAGVSSKNKLFRIRTPKKSPLPVDISYD